MFANPPCQQNFPQLNPEEKERGLSCRLEALLAPSSPVLPLLTVSLSALRATLKGEATQSRLVLI